MAKKQSYSKNNVDFFLNIPKIIWKTDCWGEINSTQNNSLEYKKPHQNRLTFFGTELKQSQQW